MLLTYAICILFFGVAIYIVAQEAKNVTSQFKLAVVDEEDSAISGMCFNILNSQQFSENITRFEKVSLDDAKEGIKSGRYAIATILEKGIIDKIRSGEKAKLTLYVNDKYEIAHDVIKNISGNAANMLIAGQCGVFAGEKVLSSIDISKIQNINYFDFYNKYIINSNLNLMSLALKGKNQIFDESRVSYKKSNVSLIEFYIISFVVLVLLFGNISVYNFYRDDFTKPIVSRLKSYKVGANSFFLGKIILPSVFSFVLLLIIILLKEDLLKNPMHCIFLFICILLLNLWSLFFAIYIKNKYNYIIILTTFAILFTFLNGGILPRSMMPYEILSIVNYTPYGVAFSHCTSLLTGVIDFKIVLLTILYIFIPYVFIVKAYKDENI